MPAFGTFLRISSSDPLSFHSRKKESGHCDCSCLRIVRLSSPGLALEPPPAELPAGALASIQGEKLQVHGPLLRDSSETFPACFSPSVAARFQSETRLNSVGTPAALTRAGLTSASTTGSVLSPFDEPSLNTKMTSLHTGDAVAGPRYIDRAEMRTRLSLLPHHIDSSAAGRQLFAAAGWSARRTKLTVVVADISPHPKPTAPARLGLHRRQLTRSGTSLVLHSECVLRCDPGISAGCEPRRSRATGLATSLRETSAGRRDNVGAW